MTSQWPGYKAFKFTKNVKGASGFVTRATIATQVAEAFTAFINDNAASIPQNDTDGWRVGETGITLDHMILLGIDIVSVGSVQPRIAVPLHVP
ncbi:hypothetical protein EIP86_000044 [Pleurotus ostreatoroseus]|nr:hypothetical protein EIP86_000044 [Pleurotus ostreatoroseus]